MKKILVITPFFYPHVGGSERYMEKLYENLLKLKKVNVDLLCYNTEKAKEKEEYKGMMIYRLPAKSVLKDQFALANPFSVLNFLLSHKDYDLIHTSTRFFDSSWWIIPFAKLTKTKLVMTDHCAFHPKTNSKLINFVVLLTEKSIVRFSLLAYDKVFSQNKKTKDFLKREFKVNSTLAYPGIDNKLVQKNSKKNKNGKVKIVYVGRLIKSKGVGFLVDLAKEVKEAEFLIAGDGSERKNLEEKVKKLKLKNIKILGNLSKKETEKLLSSSDIFAYPSWHSEGLPMAILEAGEKKMAVLSTKIGAIDEVILSNKTGIIVGKNDKNAFKDSLLKLVKDGKLREKLGNNLHRFIVNNFDWQKSANLLLKELQ